MSSINEHVSDVMKVKEFTEGASGEMAPLKPTVMSSDAVMFIIRMIMSELDELVCTVTPDDNKRDEFILKALKDRDKCHNFVYKTDDELIAAQFDALVDVWYYSLDTSVKHGVNLSKIFDLVHSANMAKRDPTTGKFLKRKEDGKIIKPIGWMSPNVEAEIKDQRKYGSWSTNECKHTKSSASLSDEITKMTSVNHC